MSSSAVFTFSLSVMGALCFAATPVEKSGSCPTFTRSTPAATDNWQQFPNKPSSEFPTNTIQDPVKAAQSINCIQVSAGLKAQLWASEEMPGNIKYLQDITWDERGRLWGVEPISYPNNLRPATGTVTDQKFTGGADRIIIMEDVDHDGVMDKFKVFRDGLNMPQGILCVNGGVVVAMGEYLAFFPNKNDTSGTPQILFSGMGPTGNYDTHGGINSLMQGLDNWIYGNTGYNSCKASPGSVDCGSGKIWRFQHTALGQPKTTFEVWSTMPANQTSNAHGVAQTEDGEIFHSGATGTPHIFHAPLQGNSTIDIRTSNAGSPNNVYYPITGDRYLWEGSTGKDTHPWFTSGSTAVSGLHIYTARLYPQKYWSHMAFTCEGASKLVNQDSLVENGSTWKAVRLPGPDRSNLIASTDAWVAPIRAKVGPDEAVWVLDWSNYLFLHNPASPSGNGGAWQNALRTKTSSRIYRIVPQDGVVKPVLDLSNATSAQLINALGNTNMFWRLQAQRLLIGAGYTAEVGTALETILTTDKGVDEIGNNGRVTHALWTLQGLGRFDMASESAHWDPILKKLLNHPSAGVRRNVLRAMPRTAASGQSISDACIVNDGNGHVRLQALVALGELPTKMTGVAMQSTFLNLDASSKTAAAAAGVTAGTGCNPTLETAAVYIPSGTTAISGEKNFSQPRNDLKFMPVAGALRFIASGQLPSGSLTLTDLQGRVVFQSSYAKETATWSKNQAAGLQQPVVVWSFRGIDGTYLSGRVTSFSGK